MSTGTTNETAIQSFHLRGASTGDAVIATVTVNFFGDGHFTFLDAASDQVVYAGDCPQMNLLLQMLVVGTNGLPAGTKLFGFA